MNETCHTGLDHFPSWSIINEVSDVIDWYTLVDNNDNMFGRASI